jgi:predicted DNA repair protein MutK
VVWAVGVGSLKNKLILVPAALAISALLPWAVTPLLMLGGLYLCLEGVEKLAHKWLHGKAEEDAEHAAELAAVADETVDMAAYEKDKIKGAIRTDFVLSAEIIVIALGTVADQPFGTQVAVLAGVGLLMTVGVYGFVAGIVKLDDLGAHLLNRRGTVARTLGRFLLVAAPQLMRLLTVVGTAAMFLVGGGILAHGIAPMHHAVAVWSADLGWFGGPFALLVDALTGIVAGSAALAAMTGINALRKPRGGR